MPSLRVEGSAATLLTCVKACDMLVHKGAVACVIAGPAWRTLKACISNRSDRGGLCPTQGVATSVYAATAPELEGQSGAYLEDCRVKTPSRPARDPAQARRDTEREKPMCVVRRATGSAVPGAGSHCCRRFWGYGSPD